ncbi:Serine/threonine-protein kinase RIO1 [Borealophlyctis nickersoniae]|nr:Serine/threonine-protein kinase RIO1 [Borealophlyctis nickersoniae]
MSIQEQYVEGQFSDAEEDAQESPTSVWQKNVHEKAPPELELASDDDEDDFDLDEDDEDEDFDLNYGDQWFSASGDFTKQYNRLRTQVSATTNASTPAKPISSAATPSEGRIPSGLKGQAGAAARKAVRAAREAKFAKEASTAGDELSQKYAGRIKLDGAYEGQQYSASVAADIKTSSRKAEGDRHVVKDKSDRATVEQVLDPRTRIILFKMLNRNVIYEINGCISTGKEANVYHATTDTGEHRAIKVYKTSILTFKDRDRYVAGEFRFRHGYSKSNPRKMVKTWAEKEMRNLKRLWMAGIPCPEALLLRMHVLLMTFIGDKQGWAAPRLKDAVITEESVYRNLYYQLVKIMWVLYHRCRLVHADLSEYNLLYHNKKLYVIDVSQSVEHDHPHALEFLRKDCTNTTDYFRKRLSEQIMTTKDLFNFIVTDVSGIADMMGEKWVKGGSGAKVVVDGPAGAEEIDRLRGLWAEEDAIVDKYLEKLHAEIAQRPAGYLESAAVQMDEEVFKNVFIPRTLEQVASVDAERDVEAIKEGHGEELLYQNVTGLQVSERNAPVPSKEEEEESEGSEDDGDDSESDEEDDGGEGDDGRGRGRAMKKDEDKEAKKDRKKAAKEEKREKRKTKIPKAVKKRKQKLAASKGKK